MEITFANPPIPPTEIFEFEEFMNSTEISQ